MEIQDFKPLDGIKDAILSLRNSEEPLFLKGGRKRFSPSDWLSLLLGFGLQIDRRHYFSNEKLEFSDWWEISYQPDKATSYAHSNTRQPFHTDNAWFSDPAELNFFIMEKQSVSGGENLIYRLSRLINDLSSEEPGLLRDLSSIEVTIKKGDGTYFNKTPIINLSGDPQIFWNYYRTEKSDPEISKMCEAFFNYLEKKEASSSVEFKRSETGDCFCFNDLKMLHSRRPFEATQPRERILLQSMWKLPSE